MSGMRERERKAIIPMSVERREVEPIARSVEEQQSGYDRHGVSEQIDLSH
jgi:hypothetical protein